MSQQGVPPPPGELNGQVYWGGGVAARVFAYRLRFKQIATNFDANPQTIRSHIFFIQSGHPPPVARALVVIRAIRTPAPVTHALVVIRATYAVCTKSLKRAITVT
jgi:hypothetical protein